MVNKPIKKWSSGNFEVAIWLNQKDKNGDKVEFKTASLSRSWKKKEDDTWRNDVVNLRRGDIPKAILLLQKAQEELYLNNQEEE
jgi:hypothetical protein